MNRDKNERIGVKQWQNIFHKLDITEPWQYAWLEYDNTISLNIFILGFNRICKLIKSKFPLNPKL